MRKSSYTKQTVEEKKVNVEFVELTHTIPFFNSYLTDSFTFLNKTHSFGDRINWDFLEYGRLWAYNLNYFEFLNQKNIDAFAAKSLIDQYIDSIEDYNIGLEPYPLSLRIMNWVKFLSINQINNSKINQSLYFQLKVLTKKIERHILGNHLLENAFALLWGGYFFHNDEFYQLSKKILVKQLKEQVLNDGGHFELSPMYHQIILFRILDSYNIILHSLLFEKELLPIIKDTAEKMLGWLSQIKFSDGSLPLFNDTANGIAPIPIEIETYASHIGLFPKELRLDKSGYRKLCNSKMELIADVGKVGSDYQPGHAHADTFTFELYIDQKPVIVDTGTSTYEINDRRFWERSTKAHNTVVISDQNSSQVWSGHRVAKRAKVNIYKDSLDLLDASHDGYVGNIHRRVFQCENDAIIIIDKVKGEGITYLHFHPNINVRLDNNTIIGHFFFIRITGNTSMEIFESFYAPQFNVLVKRFSVAIHFNDEVEMVFDIL
jgi:hypothetical protein